MSVENRQKQGRKLPLFYIYYIHINTIFYLSHYKWSSWNVIKNKTNHPFNGTVCISKWPKCQEVLEKLCEHEPVVMLSKEEKVWRFAEFILTWGQY